MKQELSKNYYDEPINDQDFYQIAVDVYGNAIRDNSFKEIVELGKMYHETGEV